MNILITYRSGANKLRLRDKNVYPCDAVQYIRITCLSVYRSVAVEADSRVTILSPAGKKKFKKFISVTMVMDTPPSYLFIAPMGACT